MSIILNPTKFITGRNWHNNSTTTQTMENNKTAENQVSFETEMTSIALDKSVEKKKFSFEEKVPKLVNITNKRGEKSEIITSSPYKRMGKN